MEIHILIPLLLLLVGAETAEDDAIFFRSTLPPAEKTYKILFLSPSIIKSHMLLQHPVMIALANRGHKVVALSEPSWTDRHVNVTYVDTSAHLPSSADVSMFAVTDNPLYQYSIMSEVLPQCVRNLFGDPVVQELYKIRKEFDIIIIDELMFVMLYPFVHGTTFAKISASTLHPQSSASFGNPLNPAFVPSNSMEFPRPYSTWHRFKNCMHMLAEYIVYRYLVPRLTASEIASRFPSLPPLHEVESNSSLFMISSDFQFDNPFPVVPLLVPAAGLSFQPAKPLSKDVSEFLSGHTPVIYVSMGTSYGHSKHFPQVYKDIFFSVFSQLPYKIILKFDEHPKQHYKNIFIRKWFRQQDILAHPNVKACFSHGGIQTVHESIRHGVPILGIPIMPEHRKMIQNLVIHGQGLIIEWSELSERKLNESIIEIMENPSYQNKMAEKSRIVKDRRESPLDKAVYWIEYVIRHKGAPHLQSPAKHLSWIEILNLDIIALFFFIVYVIIRIQVWSLRKLITWMSKKRRQLTEKKKIY